MNTLLIGDTHFPFCHRNYFEFCVEVKRVHNCKRVCHVGDVVDLHSNSFHDHDPDGVSPGDELTATRKELKKWFKAFPRVDVAIGNHDSIIQRKAYSNGLPTGFMKSFADIYDAPKGWRFDWEHRYGNWRLIHGTGTSGHDAAFKSAVKARISTAQGHIHSAAGVKFHASEKDIIWGLQCGNGLNRHSYAFHYGRSFLDKPILGCGVVLENGTIPMFVPMPL